MIETGKTYLIPSDTGKSTIAIKVDDVVITKSLPSGEYTVVLARRVRPTEKNVILDEQRIYARRTEGFTPF